MRIVSNVLAVIAIVYWFALLIVAYLVLLFFWQLFRPFVEERE